MKEIYILHVDEDAPTIHPVAFATLKGAQDYCERWQALEREEFRRDR